MRQIERVRRARSQLVMKHPFYGCLALNLKLEASTRIKTMAVNTTHLLVNEDWVATLPDDQMRGVLVHEVKHLVYGHPFRRGHRDPRGWNTAGDYAINRDIIAEGFELPDCRLFDPRFDGLCAEQIYATLQREAEEQHKQLRELQQKQRPQDDESEDDEEPEDGEPGATEPDGEPEGKSEAKPSKDHDESEDDEDDDLDPGGCGEVLDAEGDQPSLDEAEATWKAQVLMAAAIHKAQCGSLPAEIERIVGETRKAARSDWRQLLRRFINQSVSRDYSWRRPNRRFMSSGLYLPNLEPDAIDHILVGIDTSGSVIDPAAQEAFSEELQGLLDCGVVDKVTVVYCDVEIHGEPEEYQRGDVISLRRPGGGGTDFAPVTTWAADQQAACLVYFTDLQCWSFGEDPGLPVMWARWGTFSNPRLPFGDEVEIDPYI